MMHTMWKGSISFGLVNIPVKLHAATENKDVKFRSLHKKCHTPIKYERYVRIVKKKYRMKILSKDTNIRKVNLLLLKMMN